MNEIVTRPCPDSRGAGKKYWSSGRNATLSIPLCTTCNKAHWYPRLYCPHCGANTLKWINCSGKGEIHTFTVVRQSAHRYFKSKVPYILAMVALEEGPLLMSNVIDCSVDEVAIGLPVKVTFEDAGDNLSIPLFKLAPKGI